MRTFVLKADDDPDPILRDGQRMRTGGVVLMDAARKALADDAAKKAAAMHRPGSIAMTDADRQARTTMLQNADKKLSERWKNPPALETARPVKDLAARYQAADKRLTERWRSAGGAA
jgi:hypothetical protein